MSETPFREGSLSRPQEGFWLAQEIDPDSPKLHTLTCIRVKALDCDALRRAWDVFVNRHGALRTTFHRSGSTLVRHVHSALDAAFAVQDVAGIDDKQLLRCVVEDSRRPFDLAQGSARLTVFRVGVDDYAISICIHHLNWDATSGEQMLVELPVLYSALRRRTPIELPPPPAATYDDFIDWHGSLLSSERGGALREFWRQQLADAPRLDLPTDRPRRARRLALGASHSFVIDPTVLLGLRAAKGRQSLFRTLVAAYVAFLHRYTGQSDLLIGTPSSLRMGERFAQVPGNFINPIVIRAQVEASDRFADLLARIGASVASASDNRELPFMDVVDTVRPRRDPARTVLYETDFSLVRLGRVAGLSAQNLIAGIPSFVDLGELSGDLFHVPQQEGQLDLQIISTEYGGRLYGEIKYNPDLFEPATGAALAKHWSTILARIAQDPDCLVRDLPIPEATPHSPSGDVLETRKATRNQLGSAPRLTLPTDRPRRENPSSNRERVGIDILAATTRGLRDLARSEGTTLFVSLLAGFGSLLARYARQYDFVLGGLGTLRSTIDKDSTQRSATNPIPFHLDLSGDPTARELLRRVQNGVFEANLPSFDVVVVLEAPDPNATNSAKIARASDDESAPTFDLVLTLKEVDDGLSGHIEYAAALFESATIERLAGHLRVLLDATVQRRDQAVSALPILTEAEQRQLLAEWNDTRPTSTSDDLIHELFEAQAVRTPAAIAVVFEGKTLTYRELNARANGVAHRLRSFGVGPEAIVGVFLERSLELLVALLAVLKAGGAYLPLDPTYPKERVAFMLEDARVDVLVTQEHLGGRLPEHHAHVLSLSEEKPPSAAVKPPTLRSGVRPTNVAYVIYTSGSTGVPKGVQVTHANVTRLFHTTQAHYHFEARDVWTLFHSYAFDFSVWEIWGALIYGGRLVVVSYDTSRSPDLFYELLADERVTVLNQTPSAFRQLIQAEASSSSKRDLSLRFVIFGGEALDLQSLRPWFERHGDIHPELVNMYGITETTVHVTYRPLRRSDLDDALTSPIGRCIPDLYSYVLDGYGQLVPIGIEGELYVGGQGVARGYLNRPELTAQRFVPDPYGVRVGARLYKTGDLGRWRPDGTLAYLGRIDHQVKIRGFRIELGEIESALMREPHVQECAVIARDHDRLGKHLVAYVVPSHLDTRRLREALQPKLPEYMIPAAFVPLERLPLTANGKLDRAALPTPDVTAAQVPYVPPQTPSEEAFAEIWQEVLGVPRVGIHDNFFSLGGDSILSVRVIAHAAARGLTLTIGDTFRYQTISQLANAASESVSGADPSTSMREVQAPPPMSLVVSQNVRLSGADVQDAYPATGMQALMVAQYALRRGYYHTLDRVRIRDKRFDPVGFQRACETVVARHPALRSTFLTDSAGETLLVVRRRVQLPFHVYDMRTVDSGQREDALRALLDGDAMAPLTGDPDSALVRIYVVRLDADEYEIVAAIHHGIEDGWSQQIIIKELVAEYARWESNTPTRAEAAVDCVKELVALEHEIAGSDRAWSYWKSVLGDGPSVDSPGDAMKVQAPETLTGQLSDQVCVRLHAAVRQTGIPLKALVLAAYTWTLARDARTERLTLGVVSNGRSARLSDALNAVGLFWNMAPFCCTLQPTLRRHATAVQQTLVEREPFVRFPLPEITRRLGVENLFEATLNFANFHNATLIARPSLRIVGGSLHDSFHWPVNLGVFVSPFTKGIQAYFHYQPQVLPTDRARNLLTGVTEALSSMADWS